MKDKKDKGKKKAPDPSDMEGLLKAKKNKDRKDRWADLLKKDHQIKRNDKKEE